METKMEKYEKPEMEVIIFDEEDKQIIVQAMHPEPAETKLITAN